MIWGSLLKCQLLTRPTLCNPWTVARQASLSMEFPGKNTGVGCHFLLQGVFPTQGLNLGLLHCRQTLHHLSHLNMGTWNVNRCSLCGNSAEIPQQTESRVHEPQQPRFWEFMLILCDEVTLGRSLRLGACFQGTRQEQRWTARHPQCHRAAGGGVEPPTPHTVNPCRFGSSFTKILK